jgi:hypothetical protein
VSLRRLWKILGNRTLGKHDAQLRREEASAKAVRAQQSVDRVSYRLEPDDVLILSGPYRDRRVRELFTTSAVARDYIVKHLWSTGDPDIVALINSMVY